MVIQFRLSIDPVAKGRPRFASNGHCVTPEKTKEYEEEVRSMLNSWSGSKYFKHILRNQPLSITLRFFIKPPLKKVRDFPCVKPDLDNYAKAILDAMNGIVFEDDGQITELTLSKAYCWIGQPGTECHIETRELGGISCKT